MTKKTSNQLVSVNYNESEIIQLVKQMLKPGSFYLKTILQQNNLFMINDISKDIHDISIKYSYREYSEKNDYINNTIEIYFDVDKLKENEINTLKKQLEKVFEHYLEFYFNELNSKLLYLKLDSINDTDYKEKKFKCFCKYIDGYRKYLTNDKNVLNQHEILIKIYRYAPFDTRRLIEDCEISKDITLGIFSRNYKKIIEYNIFYHEKRYNKLFDKLVKQNSKRIVELHNIGLSLRKIQRTLTDECIKNGLIPKSIDRVSRKKNDSKKKVTVPSLLSIKAIKEVINNISEPKLIEYSSV